MIERKLAPPVSPETALGHRPEGFERIERIAHAIGRRVNAESISDEQRWRDEVREEHDAKYSLAASTYDLLGDYLGLAREGARFQAPYDTGWISAIAQTNYPEDSYDKYVDSRHNSGTTQLAINIESPSGQESRLIARLRPFQSRETRQDPYDYSSTLSAYQLGGIDIRIADPKTGKLFDPSKSRHAYVDAMNATTAALKVLKQAHDDGTLIAEHYDISDEMDMEQ